MVAFQIGIELRLMKNLRKSFDALERLRTSIGCKRTHIYNFYREDIVSATIVDEDRGES